MNAGVSEEACLACGGPLAPLWRARDRLSPRASSGTSWLWYRCTLCGLLRLPGVDPRGQLDPVAVDAREYADPAAHWSDRLHEWAQGWLLAPELSLLAGALPRHTTATVLEIGCGSGQFAAALRHRCPQIETLGVEPRPAAARLAARAGVRLVGTTWEDAKVDPESVDAVVLIHVLEHFARPVECLQWAARCLRPGGIVMLSVPAADSWEARLFGPRWYGLATPLHEFVPAQASIRAIVRRAGLSVRATSSWSYRAPLVGFAASLLPALEPSRARRLARTHPIISLAAQAVFGLAMLACAPATLVANAVGRGSSYTVIAGHD